VLLTVHTGRHDIVDLARTSAARLMKGGITVRLLAEEADDLRIEGAEVVPGDENAARDAEIVMVFGGDGTFLRAAELARYTDAALMGVNLGRVGFLAETEPEAVEDTLSAIERCLYEVEERLALHVDVLDSDGAVVGETWALNEVSVEKAERSRVLDVVLAIDGPVDLVVADLSFISLRLVLPALVACTREGADLLPMVTPQFEVGRERLGAGGVVRDPEHRVQAVLDVARAAEALEWGTAGVVASPLPGPAGNVEFFLWLRRDAPAADESRIVELLARPPAAEG
jgi:hypothetical protein